MTIFKKTYLISIASWCIFTLGALILLGFNQDELSGNLFWMVLQISILGLLILGAASAFHLKTVQSDFIAPLHVLLNDLNNLKPLEQFQLDFRQNAGEHIAQILPLVQTLYQQTLSLQESLKNQSQEIQELNLMANQKDAFLTKTSDELKAPLISIIGIAESLMHGAIGTITAEQFENLELLTFGGKRLINLIDDIGDYAKLQQGAVALNFKPLSLRNAVDSVLKLSLPLVGDKALILNNYVGLETQPVWADENRLQQILFNLVENAIKFTEKGQISVMCNTQDQLHEIQVIDSGCGIAAEKLESIFEVFEKSTSHKKHLQQDFGLGLSLTKKLVELHGGRIVAESSLTGSKFIFTLPISKEPLLTQSKEAVRFSYLAQKADPYRENELSTISAEMLESLSFPCRILVADGEPSNRKILVNHLSLKKWTVDSVGDGFQVLQALELNVKYDLILLDVLVPRLKGFDVCQRIREKYPAHILPVLLISSKNQAEEMIEGLSAGANDYLVKPFSKRELLARIKIHLHLAQMTHALTQSQRRLEIILTATREMSAEREPMYAMLRTAQLLLREIPMDERAELSLYFPVDTNEQFYRFIHYHLTLDQTLSKLSLKDYKAYADLVDVSYAKSIPQFAEQLSISDEHKGCVQADDQLFIPIWHNQVLLGMMEILGVNDTLFKAEDKHFIDTLSKSLASCLENIKHLK